MSNSISSCFQFKDADFDYMLSIFSKIRLFDSNFFDKIITLENGKALYKGFPVSNVIAHQFLLFIIVCNIDTYNVFSF